MDIFYGGEGKEGIGWNNDLVRRNKRREEDDLFFFLRKEEEEEEKSLSLSLFFR